MEAIVKEVEVTQESITARAQEVNEVSGISELAAIELAYVGGGTASMAFQ